MATWLLALVAAGLLAGASPSSDRAADSPAVVGLVSAFKKTGLLRDRLVGRLVGSCIREGMTGKQVDEIIGNLILDRGQFGPGNAYWVGYSRYGLVVSFRCDKADPTQERRVVRVSYSRFLGGD